MPTRDKQRGKPAAKGGEQRVLIVDDNAINRLLVQSLLEERGYKVDTAIDGQQAIEQVLRRRYGLILMDVMMPGLSGMETARRIRALGGKARDVPIVALSAEEPDEIVDSSFNGYIAKPVHPGVLLARVGERLGVPDTTPQWALQTDTAFDPLGEPLIDGAPLASLRVGMSPDSYRALLAAYLDSGKARIERIRGLIAAGDLLGVVGEAHDLKSTSGSFGAPRLSRLARQLEKACKSGDTDQVSGLMPEIEAVSKETWRALDADLGNGSAVSLKPPTKRARS